MITLAEYLVRNLAEFEEAALKQDPTFFERDYNVSIYHALANNLVVYFLQEQFRVGKATGTSGTGKIQ